MRSGKTRSADGLCILPKQTIKDRYSGSISLAHKQKREMLMYAGDGALISIHLGSFDWCACWKFSTDIPA